MVRSTGAGVAAGVGAAGGAPGAAGLDVGAGVCGAGAAWASSGAAEPPSTVPTRSKAPARRLKLFDLEITRPRLVVQMVQRRASPQSPGSPAPTLLANQALKPVP